MDRLGAMRIIVLSALLCLLTTPARSLPSPAWTSLKKHLNTLPAFTCGNVKARPHEGWAAVIYFAEIERAQQELKPWVVNFQSWAAINRRRTWRRLPAVDRRHRDARGSQALPPALAI